MTYSLVGKVSKDVNQTKNTRKLAIVWFLKVNVDLYQIKLSQEYYL